MRTIGLSFRSYKFVQGVVTSAFLALVAVAALIASANEAKALCVLQPITGSWVNMDPQARTITRAVISFNCNDMIAIPADGPPPTPPPPFQAELWGQCTPTDCPWGRVNARPSPDVAIVGRLLATYNHGFARRSVTMRLSGEILLVTVFTNFVDPGRRDYTMTARMRRM